MLNVYCRVAHVLWIFFLFSIAGKRADTITEKPVAMAIEANNNINDGNENRKANLSG